MPARHTENDIRPVRDSVEEYGRGIAGGLLFSLPMLYTMEVWWRGFTADPRTLLLFLLTTFIVLLGYNRYSGVHPGATMREVAIESIEEMGLGLLLAAVILYLLGRIHAGMALQEMLGKTVIEAMTVAIGVSVGTAQLGVARDEQQDQPEDERPPPDAWGQLVLGFCGAVLVASNVAPTEEIPMIANQTPALKLLGLAVLSLTICGLVFHYSGFVGADRHVHRGGVFRNAYGIIASYATALLASALLLWFFGQFSQVAVPRMVAQTVVLALPASLGASAGRLLIQ